MRKINDTRIKAERMIEINNYNNERFIKKEEERKKKEEMIEQLKLRNFHKRELSINVKQNRIQDIIDKKREGYYSVRSDKEKIIK